MHGTLPAGCAVIAHCARQAAGPGLPTGIAAAAALVVVLFVAVVTEASSSPPRGPTVSAVPWRCAER